MGKLTSHKPKVLVPVEGRPILFHLFAQFPEAEFVIVGDYMYEVLESYLGAFAPQGLRYKLVRSTGKKGNAAGIRDALEHVPAGEPLMLVWSDLILSKDFTPDTTVRGCQVGTVPFPCSWSLTPAGLEKTPSTGENGVAGLFVFDDKSWLADLPDDGSFSRWLQMRADIPLSPLPLTGCRDVGTLDAYHRVETTENRCRPYNKIELQEECIIKTALTPEAETLIAREVTWYTRMAEWGFSAMPKLLGTQPLTLERIRGENIFLSELNEQQKVQTLDNMISAVLEMHSYAKAPADEADLLQEYYRKTIDRLHSIRTALPMAEQDFILINGRRCINVLRHPETLEAAVRETLLGIKEYCPIHGDCQLTNTLVDAQGRVFFIDARGYFGKSQVLGDPRYDWAKIYYAISGNFDQFNVKNFTLSLNAGAVQYAIGSGGWEGLVEHFFSRVPASEANISQIRLIHTIAWLSMGSHVWEDYDSMCVAYFNGLYLFQEWVDAHASAALQAQVHSAGSLRLSPLPHTWVLDFDGTLVRHNGYKTGEDEWLPGALEFLRSIPEQDYVLILTARFEEDAPAKTKAFLAKHGVRYNEILFNMPQGERILINDAKPSGLRCAYAVSPLRDAGPASLNVEIDPAL